MAEETISDMLETLSGLYEARDTIATSIRELEFDIHRAMKEMKATKIDHAKFESVEIVSRHSYDQSRLSPLKELLPEDRLKSVYTPEHYEQVRKPESWNIARLRSFVSLGGDIRKTIESARYLADERLMVKAKRRDHEDGIGSRENVPPGLPARTGGS